MSMGLGAGGGGMGSDLNDTCSEKLDKRVTQHYLLLCVQVFVCNERL